MYPLKKSIAPIFFLILSLLILISPLTEAANFEFKTKNSFLCDISEDREDWYITRLWAESDYKLPLVNRCFKIAPFLETRYHFHLHKFSRTEVGIEIGKIFFQRFYWAESLQYASLHPGRDSLELESILWFQSPFTMKKQRLQFYIFEEHTFAFVIGEGKENDIGTGFIWQPNLVRSKSSGRPAEASAQAGMTVPPLAGTSNGAKEKISISLGWRHTDRIHDYDSDQVEVSVKFDL